MNRLTFWKALKQDVQTTTGKIHHTFHMVSSIYGNDLKFGTLFSFCSKKMLVIRAGTHKMLVRKANQEDPDQTASEEAV